MRKPFFSIIVPTYNRSKELKFAIDSVINQTFKNWELILVDNNSKDGTKKLIDNYNNSKIKLFTINNYGNIAKSRNLGIKKSKGKYLALLDSDDVWMPNKLSECLKYFNKNTKLVYHDMYIQKKINQSIFRKSGMCRKVNKPVYDDLVFNGPAFPTSSVVLEKKIFKKINFFSEKKDLITWEDYEAWIRLSKITDKFKKVDEILGYRWSGKENTLKPNRLIKNIFFFKKKYLRAKEFPNWCKLALMKNYYYTNQIKKSSKIISKIDFKTLSFIDKIKIILFIILINLKKIIKI